MYIRLKGTPFTIKNKTEKNEIIKQINNEPQISKYMKCVGIDAEQFTGKILRVLFQLNSSYVGFLASGEFPVLKLTNPQTNAVFTIEFPNKRQKETPLAKEKLTTVKKLKPQQTEKLVEPEKPVEEKIEITTEPEKQVIDPSYLTEKFREEEVSVGVEISDEQLDPEEKKEESKLVVHKDMVSKKTRKKKQLTI